MLVAAAFVSLVFLYSLVSRRLQETVATAPIVFTGAGMLAFLVPPALVDLGLVFVLGLVYLEQEANLPGEETIRLAVMATVLLSIGAHGLSAVPGVDRYARSIVSLESGAPEHQATDTP